MMDYAKEYDRLVEQSNKQQEEIESLRQQLAEKDAEIERLSGDFEIQQSQLGEMLEQLAASHAREKQLREALSIAVVGGDYLKSERDQFDKLLAQPSETSALEAVIAKASEVMRERCRKVAFDMAYSDSMAVDVSQKIRAINGVTLEDLKA